MKKFDVAILGAGVAGMTAALLQARRGRRVALLEQGWQLAPLLAGFDRRVASAGGGPQSVHFETGLHYSAGLGPGEVGQHFFRELGLEVPVRACHEEGYDEIHLLPTGRRFRMAFGRERLAANLIGAFPDEEAGIVRFLERLRGEAAQSPFLSLQTQAAGPADFGHWNSRTLQEELDAHFRSPELRAIFSASTFLHGVPPGRVSFAFHSCIASGMADSVWEVDGGGRALVAAFRQALERAGVEVMLRREATRVELEGGAAANPRKLIHCADGSVVAAEVCVSTLHPKAFFEIAPPGLYRSGYLERARAIPETSGFFCTYAVNTGAPLPNNNLFLLPELDFQKFHPEGTRTPYYVNFSHVENGASAPAQNAANPDAKPLQTTSVIAFTGSSGGLADPRHPDYRRRKEEAAQAHWAELTRCCPGLTRRLHPVGSATPGTQRRYVGYSGGYGLMHDINHVGVLPVTKLPGIYLCGQSVVAPGLLGAMISAFLLDQILRRA